MILAGKNILITGGGTGVGAVMAKQFAEAGGTVTVAGRTRETLEQAASQHANIKVATVDITDEESVKALFDEIGVMDIVVANAGASSSAPLAKTSLADWQQMIDVNLTGTFLTLKEGLVRLKGKEWGRLIAVASTAGLKGYPYVAPYAAAKHGVIGLVKSMALEVAKCGITANALCPGFLNTEMTERSIANIMEKTGMSADDALKALAKNNPQGRLIEPEEVAAAALNLCGPHSEGLNGVALSISGGEI